MLEFILRLLSESILRDWHIFINSMTAHKATLFSSNLISVFPNHSKRNRNLSTMPTAYLTHIQSFCASHRLHNPSLSDEENRKHFGKCNNLNSHGHNYKIEATVVGEVDPTLGFVVNLVDVKKCLLQVIEPLDHKRLDVDIDYFARPEVVATAENIAVYIWDQMGKLLPSRAKLYNIRVHETERNFIDYRG